MKTFLPILLAFLAHPVCSQDLPYITPDAAKSVDYTLSVAKDATVIVVVGGQTYHVTSRFSTTAPHKWNSFGGSKRGWHPEIRKVGSGRYRITAVDPKYKIERTIARRGYYITVKDKFTNLTSNIIGVRMRNTITPPAGTTRLLIGGLTPKEWSDLGLGLSGPMNFEYSGPDRPFVQASANDTSSLGMVAVDDVYRAQNGFFHQDGTVGLSDNNFGLAPNSSYTIEWELYPLEKGDHFSFINRVRRNWRTASLIDGPFGFIRTVEQWSDQQITDWARKTGLRIGCYVVPEDDGKTEAFGAAYLSGAQKNRAFFKQSIDRLRALVPGMKVTLYFDGHADTSTDAQTRFADSAIILQDGKQRVWIHPGHKVPVPYFYPTLTNSFGRMQRQVISELLKDSHGGGIYWDEMSFSGIAAFTYDQKDWDAHGVEIDPETNRVVRKISSVYLLSQPFVGKMVKDLKKRGVALYGNQPPQTKTSTAWGIPRFIEYGSRYYATCTHLSTPLALGLPGEFPEGDLKTPVIKMVHDMLDYGVLYVPHVGAYSEHPSELVKQIYPITPLEIHAGCIIGKEKIITNRSGIYGWGDKTSKPEAYIYDTDGKLTDRKGVPVTKDGLTFTRLDLQPGEVAVIVRRVEG